MDYLLLLIGVFWIRMPKKIWKPQSLTFLGIRLRLSWDGRQWCMILVRNLLKDLWEDLCIGVWQSLLVFTIDFELTLNQINVIASSKSESHWVILRVIYAKVCSAAKLTLAFIMTQRLALWGATFIFLTRRYSYYATIPVCCLNHFFDHSS